MTRNLYLGADLAPAIAAQAWTAFTRATGKILREVTANGFPTCAKGLAQEILKKNRTWSACRRWRSGARARPASNSLLAAKDRRRRPCATTTSS